MNPAIDWTKAPWPASHAINRKGAQGTVWYVQTILGHVWASVWGEEWVRIEDKLPEGCEPRPAEIDRSEAPKAAPEGATHFDSEAGTFYRAGEMGVSVWYNGIGWVEAPGFSLPDNARFIGPVIISGLNFLQGQEWLRSQRPEDQFSESMRDAIALAEEELKVRKAYKTDENLLKEERTAREFPCDGYEKLHNVFRQAHDHAAYDKGAERHANDLPFHEQRMQTISEGLDSPLGMAYQVEKKIKEGLQMADYGACRRELLGALNYLAGIVIFLDKKNS